MTLWGIYDLWSILISTVYINREHKPVFIRISRDRNPNFLFFPLLYTYMKCVFFILSSFCFYIFFSREQHGRRHGGSRHYTRSPRARCHRARRPRPGRTAVGRGRRTAVDQRSFRHGAQILFVFIQVPIIYYFMLYDYIITYHRCVVFKKYIIIYAHPHDAIGTFTNFQRKWSYNTYTYTNSNKQLLFNR